MFIKKSILISLVLILSLSVLVALNLDQIGNGLLLGAKYTYSKTKYLNFLGIITFFLRLRYNPIKSPKRKNLFLHQLFCLCFFMTMVFPGAVFVSEHNASHKSAYFHILASYLFVAGIILSNLIMRFRPKKEISNFYRLIKKIKPLPKSVTLILIIGLSLSILICFALQRLTVQNYSLG